MGRRSTTPKQFSAYLVTASDEPSMPVGAVLLEKGALLIREWNVMDFESGKTTGAVGKRLVRLCPTCRVNFRSVGALGHDGECGSDEVKKEGLAEIRHAEKQAVQP